MFPPLLVIEINQGADVAAELGSALGSHVLPLAGRCGARQGQAQPADVPRESLPPLCKFGADFYTTEPSHLPSCLGKHVNNTESTGTHPQWLRGCKMEML